MRPVSARAVALAKGVPFIALAVVTLLFQDSIVHPQANQIDVRPHTGTRRRSLLQAQPITGGAEDRADDRGEADGDDLPDDIAEPDDVDLVDEPTVEDDDAPLTEVDPDNVPGDVDGELDDELDGSLKKVDHVLADPRSYEFWEDTTVCVALMCLSSAISGLSSGVLSVDVMQLELFLNGAGDADEKRWAEKLWPVVSCGHWFLASVSIMNSMANVALPLFLDQILDTRITFAVSVPLVVLFGEILPAAWFNAKHKLKLSAGLAPIALVIMVITFPLSYPLGKLLDVLVGNDHYQNRRYSRQELLTLVQIHQVNKFQGPSTPLLSRVAGFGSSAAAEGPAAVLQKREAAMINHAMGLTTATAHELVTPLSQLVSLPTTAHMNAAAIAELVKSGHEHVPVYVDQPHNLQYYCSMQRLLLVDHREALTLGSCKLRRPLVLHSDATLMDILYDFQMNRTKFALVSKDPAGVLAAWQKGRSLEPGQLEGIITSTDVVDQLIGEHLQDADNDGDGALVGPAADYKTFTEGVTRSMSATHGESVSGESVSDEGKLDVHQSNISNEVIKQSLLERAINKFVAPLRNRRVKAHVRRRPRSTPHERAKLSPGKNSVKEPLLKQVSEGGEESKPQQGTAAATSKEESSDNDESPRRLHRENSDDGDVEDDDGSDDADSIDH